jgi:predicted RNA-binding Zn-ribbon protein involved in translation (DUF1610 family)
MAESTKLRLVTPPNAKGTPQRRAAPAQGSTRPGRIISIGGGKGGVLGGIGSAFRTSSSGSSDGGSWVGPIFDINFPTRTITKTAVHQVNVPVAPKPITCESCGRSYIPAETHYTCPGCGTAAPRALVLQSREGGEGSAMISADGTPLSASDKKVAFETLTPQFRRRRGVFIQGRALCLADVVSLSAAAAGSDLAPRLNRLPCRMGRASSAGREAVSSAG